MPDRVPLHPYFLFSLNFVCFVLQLELAFSLSESRFGSPKKIVNGYEFSLHTFELLSV